jgi:hypothetical protein
MSTEPKKDSSTTARLAFEPNSGKRKSPKRPAQPAAKSSQKKSSGSQRSSGIPDAVSRRMGRRMAIFSGVPTFFGMLTFVISYLVIKQGGIKLPNSAVLLVSLAFFGLGVLGLSYGILSASWDEEAGSVFGVEQFGKNFDRLRSAWREARQKRLEQSSD